jgi:hypothetical protein
MCLVKLSVCRLYDVDARVNVSVKCDRDDGRERKDGRGWLQLIVSASCHTISVYIDTLDLFLCACV